MLSKRVKQLKPSSTLTINKKVLALKARGKEIISFGVGEPNFNVPEAVKSAVLRALEENFSRYTPSDGIPELKQAIAGKLKIENNLDYEEKNIMAGTGAKQCLYNVFQVLLDPGDEVILPAPYWVSYPEQIKLAGGAPVFVDTAPEFRLKAVMLLPAITSKTKIIVLNSPNNPTGMMIESEELAKIAQIAVEKNIFVVSDEVYEYFSYNLPQRSIASLGEEIKNRTITINSLSKSAGMTGWRLGYAAGPAEIIEAMKKLQEQTTSNPSSLSQKAAIAALNLGKSWLAPTLEDFKKKRDYVVSALNKMGFNVSRPDGAFYVFFDVSKCFTGHIRGSTDFCRALLEKANVALVPGEGFGNNNCVRLSYAIDWPMLEKGMKMLEEFLKI